MPLALFDLDHTLLTGDSDHSWGHFMAERELVDATTYFEHSDYYLSQYNAGRLNIQEFLGFQLAPLAGRRFDTLANLRAEYLAEKIHPLITPPARELVERHRIQGDTLAMVTATNDFITRPIADLFGIEHLIATEAEIVDGVLTGRFVGEPCFQDGKVTKLRQWLGHPVGALRGSWFYTDSHNDLPLLELVDHPVPVNPDPVLEQEAKRRGWRIVRF